MNDSIFRKELAFVKPYSPGKPIEDVKRELGLERIEKLASNENPLGPSPLAIEAMKSELSRVHMYPDSTVLELRSAIAAANGLGAENVLVANGGEHVLYIIAQTFIDEGDEAVMPYPSFDLYASTITMMGGKPVIVPLCGQDHDFDAMLAAIGPRTKIVYVCNPNNPTGNIMPRAAYEAFVAKLPPRVVLFVDEAYYEYAAADPEYPHAIATLRARPNTVILRTFSKVAGIAGIRVGFALSSPEIVTQMLKTRGTFMCNRLAQVAALASMSDTEHLSRTLALNAESLGRMTEYFRGKGLDYIEPRANFVFVNLKRDSREMFDILLRRGVITRPGALWGWNTWLRVSSGSMEQTRYFLEALEAVL